jgi:2-succinyl-5-enolpyruvyl-6-hydroxy-3-cyclohexene-1-carboxylate synthase
VIAEYDVNTSFARALVDEFVRCGVTHAVVSPGSRNTPLALALARETRLRVDIVLDERSAGFRALGIGRASGRPAIVCCTSGTATANLYPAVIEAHHGHVPLLVCTADRPPELRDAGAPQTIDQTRLYAGAVRWFHDPGPPEEQPSAAAQWRTLACRAVDATCGSPRGPVHLNLPFREPLVPTGLPLLDDEGRPDGRPFVQTTRAPLVPDHATISRLADFVRAHPRGMLVAGCGARVDTETAARFARASGWPVLADPLSQLRTPPHAISTYEALLRADAFARRHRPEVVVRVGAPLTSKIANAWFDGVPHVVVDPDGAWLDPDRVAHEHLVADADLALMLVAEALGEKDEPAPWLEHWLDAEHTARVAIDQTLDALPAPIEGRLARDIAAALPAGSALVVGSSLPVRALEWCMAPRTGCEVIANRGANGIDGFVSTVGGVAIARASRPTVGLCGDLTLLHDVNGLRALDADGAAQLVVIDNDGGGIFEYLPQQALPEFEALFATPHGLDLVAVARAHGVDAIRVDGTDWSALREPGPRVIVVPVDRTASVEGHRALWHAVLTALGD